MEDSEEDWDMTQPVTFQHAGSILATMGFLQESVTEEKPDYKLFEELWELLEGTAREGVRKDDLAYALMVIRGAREPSREIDCQAVEDKQGLARFIVYDSDGNL